MKKNSVGTPIEYILVTKYASVASAGYESSCVSTLYRTSVVHQLHSCCGLAVTYLLSRKKTISLTFCTVVSNLPSLVNILGTRQRFKCRGHNKNISHHHIHKENIPNFSQRL